MNYSDTAQQAASAIVAAFEHPETLPQALANMHLKGFESPSRAWSWSNRLLVQIHGHSDARGFQQWKEVGRSVKKGAKAFYILSPITARRTVEDEEGNKQTISFPTGFRGTPVFGYSQTEGAELSNPDAEYLDALPFRKVAEKWGITVTSYNAKLMPASGFYVPQTGEIALGVSNLSTWAHEMIHAAEDRLGNLNLTRGEAYDAGEIVAELGGAALLTMLGFEKEADLGGAFRYCQSYCKGGDVIKKCTSLLNRICYAIDLILTEANASNEKAA